jgi:hypothetical protein
MNYKTRLLLFPRRGNIYELLYKSIPYKSPFGGFRGREISFAIGSYINSEEFRLGGIGEFSKIEEKKPV